MSDARRDRGARAHLGLLMLAVAGVLLARPIGEFLGVRPHMPWTLCEPSERDRELLADDHDSALEIAVEGTEARLKGTLTSAVVCKMRALREAHPELDLLVLDSISGTIDEDRTIRASLMVRDWGLDTHVAPGASVASGGVTLFLGGAERSMGPGSALGVHTWAYTEGRIEGRSLPRDHPEHRSYLRFYERIGIDPAFYWFALASAGADDIHVLTQDEIDHFRLVTRRTAPRSAAAGD